MKALLLLLATAALAGTAFNKGVAPKAASTEGVALANAIHGIIDSNGRYVKITDICFNTAEQEEAQMYFHAGYYSLERITFYDENTNALLMSNVGGELFTDINSGYGKSGDDMVHFSYTGDKEDPEEFMDDENWDVNYVVQNTSPKDFFIMLSDIEDEIRNGSHVWAVEDDTYTYSISSLAHESNGYYSDSLLHKVQYFAAPLLLESVAGEEDYLSPSKITFTVDSNELVIEILSESDDGKLNNPNHILATATVTPGFLL